MRAKPQSPKILLPQCFLEQPGCNSSSIKETQKIGKVTPRIMPNTREEQQRGKNDIRFEENTSQYSLERDGYRNHGGSILN